MLSTARFRRRYCWALALVLAVAVSAAAETEARLLNAVKNADVAAVRTLLARGADVNGREPDGTTPLYWAVKGNHTAVAEALIRAGADVNAVTRYGVTPLSVACLNGNPSMVELLLAAGADANTSLPGGESALMTAARTGEAAIVDLLVRHGADVNAQESTRGQTPLMWAAGEGHWRVVRTLLEAGAGLQVRSNAGWTPLLFAAREGQLKAVRALLDAGASANDSLPPNTGGPRRRPEGAPGGADDPRGLSALHLAAGSRHYELAVFLLERGADPNAAGSGWTVLHQLTWLREPGQGSNGPPPRGSGDMDSLELVRRLAAHGADLNARVTRKPNPGTTALNLIGGTPFFLAARTADAELMRLLASLGADPLLPNEDGTTPLMAAAGAGTHSPGEDAGTEPEALEAVRLALELGNDVNVIDKNGNTAMHGAAYKQLPSVVKFLAEKGADIELWNRKNSSGWTPLRIAAGVHRGMNFRFSIPTAEALREIMTAAGASTELELEPVVSGATPTK